MPEDGYDKNNDKQFKDRSLNQLRMRRMLSFGAGVIIMIVIIGVLALKNISYISTANIFIQNQGANIPAQNQDMVQDRDINDFENQDSGVRIYEQKTHPLPLPEYVLPDFTGITGWDRYINDSLGISFMHPTSFEIVEEKVGDNIRLYVGAGEVEFYEIGSDSAFLHISKTDWDLSESLLNKEEYYVMVDGVRGKRIIGDDSGSYEGTSAGKVVNIRFGDLLFYAEERPALQRQDFDVVDMVDQILSTLLFTNKYGWKPYENDAYGIRLSIPADWEALVNSINNETQFDISFRERASDGGFEWPGLRILEETEVAKLSDTRQFTFDQEKNDVITVYFDVGAHHIKANCVLYGLAQSERSQMLENCNRIIKSLAFE